MNMCLCRKLFQAEKSRCRRNTVQQHTAADSWFRLTMNELNYSQWVFWNGRLDGKAPGQNCPVCKVMLHNWHEEIDAALVFGKKNPAGQAVGELAPGGQKCPAGQV
jgi:hypothetical protein